MGSPSLPTLELLAFAYAALQPSKHLLDKYLFEIDRLEKQGTMTHLDHQILRSSVFAQDELMRHTLGEEAALTTQTLQEILSQVTKDLSAEKKEKLEKERTAHVRTQEHLKSTKGEKDALQKRIFWSCRRKAQYCGWGISILILFLLLSGVIAGKYSFSNINPIIGLIINLGFLASIGMTFFSWWYGTTIKKFLRGIEDRCLKYFLRREEQATGIQIFYEDNQIR